MKHRLAIIYILIATLILVGYFACSRDGRYCGPQLSDDGNGVTEPVLLKIGYETAPTQSLHLCLMEMEKWLETQSRGNIKVELYPYSQLGDAPELVTLTANGIIQMTLPLTSDLAALPPKDNNDYPLKIPDSWQLWAGMDGFYLFENEKSAFAAIDGEMGKTMAATLSDLRNQPLLCMGCAYDGPLCIASGAGDIATPDCLYLKKVAVSGSCAWMAAYEEFSAQPVGIFLSEIYPALSRGQVEIYQTCPSHIAGIYLDDYSSTLILTEHAYAFRPLLVNRKWYEGLTSQQADLITSAIANFLEQQRAMAREEYQRSIQVLRERGMKIIVLDNGKKALWQ